MQEQLRIQNWLQGQAILNAQIEHLESQGASAEQIAELREQGATQGLGVAHLNASTLSQILILQDAFANSSKPHLSPDSQTPQDEWIPGCTVDNPYGLPPATLPALDWLIALYENNQLPGDTVLERTQYILDATQNGLFVHFANIPEGDSGFNPAFQDSGKWPDSGNQVGHYLTAVDISLSANSLPSFLIQGARNVAIDLIIGHEMIGDYTGSFSNNNIVNTFISYGVNGLQYGAGLFAAIYTNGDSREWFLSGEDENFEKILAIGPNFNNNYNIFRNGNSIEDLRLTYQGWVDGENIINSNYETNTEFAEALAGNLGD
jgi:hypothetical protein